MIFGPPKRSSRRLVLAALVGIGAGAAFLGMPGLPAGPRAARASIMIALDLPALVQRADHIAVVDVASVTAAWDQRHERIYSTIELKVVESWKSPSPSTAPVSRLTVVQPGGTVDDLSMTVTGMGIFVPGERSLVFLRGPANRAQVVGMTQGKRPMRYEGASRSWLVAPPDLRQAKLVHPPAAHPAGAPVTPAPPLQSSASPAPSRPPSATAVVAPTPARELPVEDLHAEIKRLLAAVKP